MHSSTFFFLILAIFILPEVIHSYEFLAGPINWFCGKESATLESLEAKIESSAIQAQQAAAKQATSIHDKKTLKAITKAAYSRIKMQAENVKPSLTERGLVFTAVDSDAWCSKRLVGEFKTPKDPNTQYSNIGNVYSKLESLSNIVVVVCKSQKEVTVTFYSTEKAKSYDKPRSVSLELDEEKGKKGKAKKNGVSPKEEGDYVLLEDDWSE